MNKKQLVTVWVGTALIIIFVFWELCEYCSMLLETGMSPKKIWTTLFATGASPVIVAALAVALTCTFADKKPKRVGKTIDEAI